MTQHNLRKEPTFGEPSASETTQETPSTEDVQKPKISISLHSKNAPSYNFTPVLKRPTEDAKNFSTLEEKAMLEANQTTEQVSETVEKKPQQAEFNFTPVVDSTQSETVGNSSPRPDMERVIPASVQSSAPVVKAALMNKVPTKYRRLVLVAGLALLLLLLLFLLKPNTPETVEQLQEQGTSLPIEFRPVDEEEAKRAEAEAKALQEAQARQALLEQQAKTEQHAQPTSTTEPVLPTQPNNEPVSPIQAPIEPVVSTPVAQPAVTTPAPTTQTTTEPSVVAVKAPEIVRPTRNESVIYQPETKPVEQPKPEKKVEKTKPAPTAKTSQEQLDNLVKVVDAKPATAGKTKTLTVPKGVSLMQVFRDNQLNISDVNAMSKVNNVVSNLKAGEKVTVTLDKNNRVVQMNIGSGGQFIRQANGTYQFK